MKKTTSLLKKEREKQKISLSEIASITKISLSTLKAIESCDQSELPPKPYLRGFVRSYAICLDLDPEKILDGFDTEMGSTKHQPKKHQSKKLTDTSKNNGFVAPFKEMYSNLLKYKLKSKTFKILLVVVVLGLILTVIVLKQMFDKYSKEASTPAVSPTITSVLEDDTMLEEMDEEEGELLDDRNLDMEDTSNNEGNISPTTTTTFVVNDAVRTVEITALGTLDISYSINGGNFVNRTLQSGGSVSIMGSNVEITTGNAGLTVISIDGENIGNPAGNMGEQFNFNIGD